MLRRKNRLVRSGRIEKADAVAKQIRAVITRKESAWLRNVNTRFNPKVAWAKVRELTKGKCRESSSVVEGLTSQILNDHYASISTDSLYRRPLCKLTAVGNSCQVTEYQIFRLFDTLRPTATGVDEIPAWFLRLGAPVFAAPFAQLFSQSIRSGIVPTQWKTAIIRPIPKVANPTEPVHLRPISVTPVLSRILERHVVKKHIYPALLLPPTQLQFYDQYAFRPTGSTTAALVAIFHTICSMLSTNPYVRVFALDFSKAFDTVRHFTLMEKMAHLSLPDEVYNWILHFLERRRHFTRYSGTISSVSDILASIIQGSALGPATYVVNAADLRPLNATNEIMKFADDTYLIVPAQGSADCHAELDHIRSWAKENNLSLNCAKSKEIVFRARGIRGATTQLPSPIDCIERVHKITALGVVVNDQLTSTDHISSLLSSCSSLLYALRVLRHHGLPSSSLHDVFRATVMAKILYCAPAWYGFSSATDLNKLESFLRRCKRTGYCNPDMPTVTEQMNDIDDKLFCSVLRHQHHVLQYFLADNPDLSYNLRRRKHNKILIPKTAELNNRNFLIRMLYRDCY